MSQDLAQLVSSAKEGDPEAFEALVRATHADIYTLACRLCGNEEDAREVVQETYLRAYRGLQRFRGNAQFSTWLYRICANFAATHLGRRNRHRHEELDEELGVVDERGENDPSLRADIGELREELKAALSKLPPKLRAVIVLRDIYDLPHESIAAELGISESAAKVRLHRARKKLRADLFPLPGEEHAHAV